MSMDPSMLPGGDDTGGAPAPPEDSSRAANDTVRQLIMQIGQLAQQIPEAQAEFGAAAKALTAASLKLVAGQQGQSPSQPLIGA